MAKGAVAPSAPSELDLRLYSPGMSILHRTGLGGLACTLRHIEREQARGALTPEQLPGGPWVDGDPPWSITQTGIILRFGRPDAAREFLKRLFGVAFQIRSGLIFLPGQYALEPPEVVRAELQNGLTQTFLQHNKVRNLTKEVIPRSYEVDGKPMAAAVREIAWYRHQSGWEDLCDKHGRLRVGAIEVSGPLNPGAVVRHVAFTPQTRIQEDVARVLPLFFAIVGCLALVTSRGAGILIAPEVTDLEEFAILRPLMTPMSVHECRVAGPSDAVLQAHVRLRTKQLVHRFSLPACHVWSFATLAWSTQQKARMHSAVVHPGNETQLEQFETALLELPPRVAAKRVKENVGRGKNRHVEERVEWFWADSVVRPLIAENLAEGKRWYEGFIRLMLAVDPVRKQPVRNRLTYERRGLNAMIDKLHWENQGEAVVVHAVHRALRQRFGQIADENRQNPAAMRRRWEAERDRWRLALAGAKTPAQFRRAFCDLLSRGGPNAVLQEHWKALLPMLADQRWQLSRDLALLGLVSYAGQEENDQEGDASLEESLEPITEEISE